MQQLNINHNLSGRKPTWKFTQAYRAMIRTGKASRIDAIRCRCEVLILKLVPFAKKCSIEYIVQEDNASSYASHF